MSLKGVKIDIKMQSLRIYLQAHIDPTIKKLEKTDGEAGKQTTPHIFN